MQLGKSFPLVRVTLRWACAGAVLVSASSCSGSSTSAPQDTDQTGTTPFPPPKADTQKVDPSEIFKNKERRAYFAPKYPELAFVECSNGLPQSGTWRGYPHLADFTADGRADLVASNREEDGYSAWAAAPGCKWLLSNDGPAKDVGGLPRDMQYGPSRSGDVNGDGRLDLLLSAHSDALRVYLNVPASGGEGTQDGQIHWMRSESPIENPFLMLDIAVGDLDGDGHLDVAGVGHFKGGISVYLGDGKGGMRRLPESEKLLDVRAFGQRIEIADLDGDGVGDIVATTNRGLRAWITKRGTPLQWEERSAGLPNPNIGNSITSLAVGRFREGRPAEIATGLVPDPMQKPETLDNGGVYGWNPEGKTWEHVESGLPRAEVYREVAAGDFNGDGKLDLLVLTLENGAVFYLGDGKGGFTPKGRLSGNHGVGRVAVGDIDGDRLPDVAISVPATKDQPDKGGVRAYLNRPAIWQ